MSEIFFYLLEHFSGISQCPDAPTLARRLAYEGFEEHEVRAAIAWVELLRQPLELVVLGSANEHSQRVYHVSERLHVGDANLVFLNSIAYSTQMSGAQRERIIERCMMLPGVPQEVEHFKALVLTILWSDNQDIDSALLHSMLDEPEVDETSH